MLEQNEGRIYLAEKRGLSTGVGFKRFHTFNDEQYFEKSRTPFGTLKVLNEEVLLAGQTLKVSLNEVSTLIFLPIVGGLAFSRSNDEPEYIVAGQVVILTGKVGDIITIENPYTDKTISFLQIQINVIGIESVPFTTDIINVTLENKNQLFTSSNAAISIGIGQYDGRNEDIYQLKNPENGLFTFVIEGAFEVHNRLLETKDGLALWNFTTDVEVEFEALSNNAIILFIEV